MASFAAFLDVQGVRYPLLTYSLAIHQDTDSLGRPASPTYGGTIDCVLAAPGADRPFLMQWMFSPTMQQDGQLVLMQDVPRTTLKTISFFSAYCVGLQMRFQPGAGGGGSLQIQVRISPQRIAVGTIIHDNNWPVESHGAGQSYAKQVAQVAKRTQEHKVPPQSAQLTVAQVPELPQNKPEQKQYSMDPKEVKRVIDAKLKGEPYNEEQFLYYHLNRNKFNVGNEVTELRKVGETRVMGYGKFEDNLGRTWIELPKKFNQYHMSKEDFENNEDPPYSRKFVCDDEVSGVGGEFEMIVRKDNKRIDSETEPNYQETYNFGRTMNFLDNAELSWSGERKYSNKHFKLDVDPHEKNSNYSSNGDTGSIRIIE
ncbi:type VI secretion system tube protein TssD [Fibrella arboris]|uniref:type VI secretion system tube protein TssD n=1 Tax=Fibrella arboris TaxID=3242486 RepID=UPI00351FF64B